MTAATAAAGSQHEVSMRKVRFATLWKMFTCSHVLPLLAFCLAWQLPVLGETAMCDAQAVQCGCQLPVSARMSNAMPQSHSEYWKQLHHQQPLQPTADHLAGEEESYHPHPSFSAPNGTASPSVGYNTYLVMTEHICTASGAQLGWLSSCSSKIKFWPCTDRTERRSNQFSASQILHVSARRPGDALVDRSARNCWFFSADCWLLLC